MPTEEARNYRNVVRVEVTKLLIYLQAGSSFCPLNVQSEEATIATANALPSSVLYGRRNGLF